MEDEKMSLQFQTRSESVHYILLVTVVLSYFYFIRLLNCFEISFRYVSFFLVDGFIWWMNEANTFMFKNYRASM